jgi:thioredoxin reductase
MTKRQLSNETIFDVMVIGCGPVGIAALYRCNEHGLNAIGIESGDRALKTISSYPEGLVLASPARHFQIGEIPIDCRRPDQLTREDVLHYYTRIINAKSLVIRTGFQLKDIRIKGSIIFAVIQSPTGKIILQSRKILIASWYQPRKLVLPTPSKFGIDVLTKFSHSIQVVSKQVVIFGSGLSALEIAMYIMMSGQSVTLVLNGSKQAFHKGNEITRLIRNTNSVLIEGLRSFRLALKCVKISHRRGTTIVNCEVVIPAIGHTFDIKLMRIFKRHKMITDDQIVQMTRLSRTSRTNILENDFEKMMKKWPNFREQFVHGKSGIHFVGAILHSGSFRAGTKISIHSALIAVDLIAKIDQHTIHSFLPDYLMDYQTRASNFNFDRIKNLKPLRITSISRNSVRLFHHGTHSTEGHQTKLIIGYKSLTKSIVSLSNGERTIKEIIFKICKTKKQYSVIMPLLYELFYNNWLTWLPQSTKQFDR